MQPKFDCPASETGEAAATSCFLFLKDFLSAVSTFVNDTLTAYAMETDYTLVFRQGSVHADRPLIELEFIRFGVF